MALQPPEQRFPPQPQEEPTPEQVGISPTGTAACGEPTLEQVYPKGLQPVERTHAGAGGTHEEAAAERSSYRQPLFPSATAVGGRVGNEGVKLCLGRRREGREGGV